MRRETVFLIIVLNANKISHEQENYRNLGHVLIPKPL